MTMRMGAKRFVKLESFFYVQPHIPTLCNSENFEPETFRIGGSFVEHSTKTLDSRFPIHGLFRDTPPWLNPLLYWLLNFGIRITAVRTSNLLNFVRSVEELWHLKVVFYVREYSVVWELYYKTNADIGIYIPTYLKIHCQYSEVLMQIW